MALSEVQPIEDIYRSDSFSDRVCDDLSEVILRYLSLEDKLRLECVSKQFQRTIYKKMNVFIFGPKYSDWNRLEVFLEVNLKSLKYLTLCCHHFKEEEELKHLLNAIPKLRNLVHLSLNQLNHGLNENSFVIHLTQMAQKCTKLESLGFRFRIDRNSCLIDGNLLSRLKQFKRLKRLELHLFTTDLDKSYFSYFSFASFEGFEELTHLDITLPFNQIDAKDLKDIDIHLPKLVSFKMATKLHAKREAAHILCRLTRLEILMLRITTPYYREYTRKQILEKCPRIKEIHFIKP